MCASLVRMDVSSYYARCSTGAVRTFCGLANRVLPSNPDGRTIHKLDTKTLSKKKKKKFGHENKASYISRTRNLGSTTTSILGP